MDYVSLTGVEAGNPRGKDFSTLNPCYFRFVKLIAPQDVVERLRCYMTTNMIFNTDKGIAIGQGMGRVIEMNKALPYPPRLKHKEGIPTAMTATKVEYMGIEL